MNIFGIDLGTTNSCIAMLRDGKPVVLPVDNPDGLVPSVVGLENGVIVAGQRAMNRAVGFPESTVPSVKRLMGSGETVMLREDGKEVSLTPEEVSAAILRHLAQAAEKLTGESVRDVVITVPAYFSDAQRRATQEAGELAGLHVRRLINEPTAAALFYGQVEDMEQDENVLVYDLGGGTFDVSILRMGEITEVLASTGDTRLGGNDLDQRVVVRLLELIRQREGMDLSAFRPALARLQAAAEDARRTLSSKAYTPIREAHIPGPDNKTCTITQELSREELEDLTEDLLARTIASVEKALEDARLRPVDIRKVVMVGGVTRMPAVAERMEQIFGDARMPVIDPDRAVACGAAIQGGILSGERCDHILVDVTPHTLSVEAAIDSFGDGDGMELVCAPIIERNTQIPAIRARTFYTILQNQSKVGINVYQGESSAPEENTLLGQVELELGKSPQGTPVVVEYCYDANGMVHLKAEQKGYGRKVEVRLDSRRPLNPVEVDTTAMNVPAPEEAVPSALPEETPMNFVTRNARQRLQKMAPGADREALEALLHQYEQALHAGDDAEVDALEDALVDMLDKGA